MNVTSASMAALPLAKLLTPNADPSGAQASPLSSAADKTSSSSTSQASGSSGEGSSPGLDVAKKLKSMSDSLIALTLIHDPVERAKAAAHLYKQYAQVAKDYAAATADGRAAAAATEAAYANGVDPSGNPDPNAQAQAAATGEVPVDVAPEAVVPADGTAVVVPPTPADPAAPQLFFSGKKPTFVPDVFMEEIKGFASAAKLMYDAAIQEAKPKADKSKLHDTQKEVDDAKDVLTEAAKAVEGPDATADGYTPSGAASSPSVAPRASIVNVTA